LSGVFGGRPKVQPVVRLYSFLLGKASVPVMLHVDGSERAVSIAPGVPLSRVRSAAVESSGALPGGASTSVPLVAIAYARSGDKGDISNIAVFARRPELLPLLRVRLTAARVREYFAHLAHGEVERYEWPGLDAFNFVLHQALGGGGVASLRYDPQGKAHAQLLLDMPVDVPQAWLDNGWITR
jgi:hypothetical protein